MGKIFKALTVNDGENSEKALDSLLQQLLKSGEETELPASPNIESRGVNAHFSAASPAQISQKPNGAGSQAPTSPLASTHSSIGACEKPAPALSGPFPEPGPSRVIANGTRSISLKTPCLSCTLSPECGDQRAWEQYRFIRTRLLQSPKPLSIVVVSSPGAGDGKTMTAVNLAATFALKSDEHVLLLDADLRRSTVHERLGVSKSPGLAEVLAGTARLEDAIFRVEHFQNLQVLRAGEPSAHPGELLESSRWKALIARLRHDFQRVIVDSPPVDWVADYDLVAAQCDGVLLVVRPDHTPRPLLTRVLAKLRPELAGVVINAMENWFLWKPYPPNYYYGPETGRKARAAK